MAVDFALATLSAISIDRLLALSLGIRYRQVVTMKRVRWCVGLVLLFSIGNCFTQYVNYFAFLVCSALMWILWLITLIGSYARIYLILRNNMQAQVIPQGQQNGISPLNLSRYKKTVSTALWVFAALMICYLPFGLGLLVQTMLSELTQPILIISFFALIPVYLNSSLNPLLHYWKIREVRHAVKETLKNFGFRR